MRGCRLVCLLFLGLSLFLFCPCARSGSLVYTYDQKDRLVSVEYPGKYRIEYSYGPAGNRTQKVITLNGPVSDFDGDNDVDGLDLVQFIGNWGGSGRDISTFAGEFGAVQGEGAGS